jgi:hypothetical protein
MKKSIHTAQDSIKNYFIHFTQTQLAITLVSLPILVTWGLGFSWMTFVGNLVFAPALIAFLFISSLLLFTQLIGIPNHYLVILLDLLTHVWDVILRQGSSSWIIECAKPPTILLICIPIITFLLLHHRMVNTHAKRFIVLGLLMVACLGLFTLQKIHNARTMVTASFHEKLYVIKLADTSSIILIDEGFFARKKSVEKAIDYELKQWINKNYGHVDIQELRITRPGAGSFKAAQYMCTRWNVQAVWLPFFEKTLTKAAWRAYFDLKRFLDENKIRFVRHKT